ncbi:hypothetical protein ILYODFUR_021629 [Ilyodon furcidens]|uniref:Uncharacterized protein n=1 Tax=Ilyodon furcidens TaxID=33524 RepID=A0ABV0VGI6_9TELE
MTCKPIITGQASFTSSTARPRSQTGLADCKKENPRPSSRYLQLSLRAALQETPLCCKSLSYFFLKRRHRTFATRGQRRHLITTQLSAGENVLLGRFPLVG